jgi:hypothetical protein
MDAEQELAESWEKIPELQHLVALQGETLAEQAFWLRLRIEEAIARNNNGWEKDKKLDLLAKLSLLSEMYAFIDFDRMIEIREKFQGLFPEHFAQFLSHLDSLSWQIFWPGCLECRHFDGRCTLGMAPVETPGGSRKLDKYCKAKEVKLKAA